MEEKLHHSHLHHREEGTKVDHKDEKLHDHGLHNMSAVYLAETKAHYDHGYHGIMSVHPAEDKTHHHVPMAKLSAASIDDIQDADDEFEQLKRAATVVVPDVERSEFAREFVRGFRM